MTLGFQWQTGLITDKKLFDLSYEVLNGYVKNADGKKNILELEELQEMADSLIMASKKIEKLGNVRDRAETVATFRLLC